MDFFNVISRSSSAEVWSKTAGIGRETPSPQMHHSRMVQCLPWISYRQQTMVYFLAWKSTLALSSRFFLITCKKRWRRLTKKRQTASSNLRSTSRTNLPPFRHQAARSVLPIRRHQIPTVQFLNALRCHIPETGIQSHCRRRRIPHRNQRFFCKFGTYFLP